MLFNYSASLNDDTLMPFIRGGYANDGGTLLERSVSVGLPIATLRRTRTFPLHTIKMLTWSGVRGAISIALALSLPPSETRGVVLVVTYVIVVFSILVQGLTVGRLAEWASRQGRSA